MWAEKYMTELNSRRLRARSAGGKKRIERQHSKGKLTARERIEYLFDKDTFTEVGSFIESRECSFGMDEKRIPGDGVITGYGMIDGRLAYVSSEDFTVIGGTLGEAHAIKICRIMDMAFQTKAPFISINDSGGARIEEGILALNGYGEIFHRHTKASGVIPQIAAVMGPCAGGACYGPALCDYVFMTERNSRMFITGPKVVKTAVGEDISEEMLGSARTHMEMSGAAHFVYTDDKKCLDGIKMLLSYLPQSFHEKAPRREGRQQDRSSALQSIVPDVQRQVYDIHKVIETFVDEDSFFEVQRDFGKSIVIGFARIEAEVIGIVANQPQYSGGVLDIDTSEKAARFVRFCDCFRIPILTLVDTPGFQPGSSQEFGGIIRRGAKLLYAYSEAVVPKVSLILRKAYGGAYIAMNSRGIGADIVYAWPISQIAVMGAEMAADIIFRSEMEQASDKKNVREELIRQYDERFLSPYIAASRGYIDEVIAPEETRTKITSAFEALKGKSVEIPVKKHGNIPL